MYSWSSSQVLQPGASLYRSVAIAYVWDDPDYRANDSDGTNPAKPTALVSRTAQSTLDRLSAEHNHEPSNPVSSAPVPLPAAA